MKNTKQPLNAVPAPANDKRLIVAVVTALLVAIVGVGVFYWYANTNHNPITGVESVKMMAT